MPAYFASDVHLRLDHPERGRRFARWVGTLGPDDSLTIVGDLCDFWFAARQINNDPIACDGLRALSAYQARGGSLTILPGNHDGWLGPYYEQVLGARFVNEPCDLEMEGLRIRLVHGHLLGVRPFWKRYMESRTFLRVFRLLPNLLARMLDRVLMNRNNRYRRGEEDMHLAGFRKFTALQTPAFDLVVIGHVHRPVDESKSLPRMVVLGGWQHQASYLRIDHTGASLVIERDSVPIACDSSSEQ